MTQSLFTQIHYFYNIKQGFTPKGVLIPGNTDHAFLEMLNSDNSSSPKYLKMPCSLKRIQKQMNVPLVSQVIFHNIV